MIGDDSIQTWTAAKEKCESVSATSHLVAIESWEELEFMVAIGKNAGMSDQSLVITRQMSSSL